MHKAQHQDAAQHDVQEGINCVWKEAVAQNFVVNKQQTVAISEQITTSQLQLVVVDLCVDTGYRYYFCQGQCG